MIDFHSHLLPAVDDGAASLDESRAAIRAMTEQGVEALVVTPHLEASLTDRPEELARVLAGLDAAFLAVRTMVDEEFPGVRLERGVELMLDHPGPALEDPRLRLAGTTFLLVEFPGMLVPPHSVSALYDLKVKGWRPIVAHPERYRNLASVDEVEEWRTVGALTQLNAGSLLGRYGDRAREIAWGLLERGWADYLSSDYHARGGLRLKEAGDALRKAGGTAQLELLTRVNPARMLAGEEPDHVPPLPRRPPLWRRLFSRSR